MKEIKLDFKDRNVGQIPALISYPGIYVVFAHDGSGVLQIWELLYIGAADNVCEAYNNNPHRAGWEKYVTERNMKLVIYTAQQGHEENQIAKEALVYKFQPTTQSAGLISYDNEDVSVVVDGRLKAAFGSFVLKKNV